MNHLKRSLLLCLIVACALMAGSAALAGDPEMQTPVVGESRSVDLERAHGTWFQAWSLMPWSLSLAGEQEPLPDPIGECRFVDRECTTEWAPVFCKKGGWFQNRCLAKQACARGCRNFFGG